MADQGRGFYFYVLLRQDQSLYAGYTVDLDARLLSHNQGKGAKYTRLQSRRPVTMVYAEEWATKSLAMQAEYYFKQKSRPQKLAYLAQHGQRDINSGQRIFVSRLKETAYKEEVNADSTKL